MTGMGQYWYSARVLLCSRGVKSPTCDAIRSIIDRLQRQEATTLYMVSLSLSLSLSLPPSVLTDHFPGEPGLAGVY